MKELKKLLYLFVAATLVVGCDDDNDNGDTPNPNATSFDRTTVQYGTGANVRTVVRYTVTDRGEGIGTRTLLTTENNQPVEYVVNGRVYVNDGQVLTVPAGAVIKGAQGTGASASTLVVAAGGRIDAQGTAQNPIIMTYAGDDVLNNAEPLDRVPGQWGGLVVIGRARTNLGNAKVIEGIASTETRATYGGGTNDDDNSGTLRYISIRNTGTVLAPNAELQGLTMAGVGRGTTVEHIESIFSNDDGIEVFGGTVNLRNIVVAFADDDAFDFDQGWSGSGQFWFGYQTDAYGNRGMEWDGDDETETPSNVSANGQPYTSGVVANLTMIGRKTGSESQGLEFRNNASMSLFNSVVAGFNTAMRMSGIVAGQTPRPSTWDHYVASRARFRSNVWANIGATPANGDVNVIAGGGSGSAANLPTLRTELTNATNNNVVLAADPFTYPAATRDAFPANNSGRVNAIPANTTGFPAVATLPASSPATFFQTVTYVGAFAPTGVTMATSWANWTLTVRVFGVQ